MRNRNGTAEKASVDVGGLEGWRVGGLEGWSWLKINMGYGNSQEV